LRLLDLKGFIDKMILIYLSRLLYNDKRTFHGLENIIIDRSHASMSETFAFLGLLKVLC